MPVLQPLLMIQSGDPKSVFYYLKCYYLISSSQLFLLPSLNEYLRFRNSTSMGSAAID